MKKIISFVLLAAMLVTLIVPSALAADPFTAVAADSIEVMEGGKTVTTGLKLAANSGNLEAFGGVIFWKADAGVADVALTIDEAVFNASNTGLGSIVLGNNRNVKNDLEPFGANTADYMACKLDMEAIAALNETGKVADITFTFENATVKGQTFTFSIVTTYANEEDPVSEDKADATITVLEDPNLGKYSEPTLFVVPEAETIVPGATTLKVDVRIDANPGMWGGLYVLTYPESWTLASDT
ncbi:MAG: hypothetical protein PUC29_05145, partial [Clostridia bacterium]|nr:hypothetical protein [Clostridia bacterium]